jgi:PIN domain nuclease of toxin-antitoxin system
VALFVVDTHVLVWYLSGSTRLSQPALQVLDGAMRDEHQVNIPAIVLAELVMLSEKHSGRFNLPVIVGRLRQVSGFHLTSLAPDMALRIAEISALPDIHDRLIVAETLTLGATLLTRDQAITESKIVSTVW